MSMKLYTLPELEPVLRLKKRVIRKLIRNGDLWARMVGRQYLVTEKSLSDYLEEPIFDGNGNGTAKG